MKKVLTFGAVMSAVAPVFAFAAGIDAFYIIGTINQILGYVMPVLISLAVVYFIWGVVQYVISSDEEVKKGARARIIQGLIGLFVIIAFWGILSLITSTFGVGPQAINPQAIPCVPGPGITNC